MTASHKGALVPPHHQGPSDSNYIEMVAAEIDQSEFTDTAQECVLNGATNELNILETLENDFLRKGGTRESWFMRYGLAQKAVKSVLYKAINTAFSDQRWPQPMQISFTEFQTANQTPVCFVTEYLYADTLLFIAPGATGKTTLKLYELATIAGGAVTLWGKPVLKHGPVDVVTAEDQREQLVARLREVIFANGMFNQLAKILANFYICDVSSGGFKLTHVEGDVVKPSTQADELITYLSEIKPLMVVIDPAISFGVGEARVNDSEQGLIEIARKIRNAVGCCVQYVHHTGKANAREKAVDQYAGRGGSAFADGARMVHVLVSMTASEWLKETATPLLEGQAGLKLEMPKMTYGKKQNPLFILRQEYSFNHVPAASGGAEAMRDQNADTVHAFLVSELAKGLRYTKSSLENMTAEVRLTRVALRKALMQLTSHGRVTLEDAARAIGTKGGAWQYLRPDLAPPTPIVSNVFIDAQLPTPQITQLGTPPLRTVHGGGPWPPPVPPAFLGAPADQRQTNGGSGMANLERGTS